MKFFQYILGAKIVRNKEEKISMDQLRVDLEINIYFYKDICTAQNKFQNLKNPGH